MILKFDQGGAALPPFLHYTPVITSWSHGRQEQADAQTSGKKSSGKSSDELSDKDLVKALDGLDGLPNEVKALQAEIQDFIVNKQMSLGGVDSSEMNLEYLDIVSKLKIAKFNANEYDKARNMAEHNGGLPEYAIGTDGSIVCRNINNPNDFQVLTAKQYLANRDKYQALTNQQLLDLRAQAPELVNNNKILDIVRNGMGMQNIQSLINSAISSIGTTTTQVAGYTKTQQQQIVQGAEYLEQAKQMAAEQGLDVSQMSVDGLYNVGVLNKSQADQAKMALSYLYSILPAGARTLLEIKAAEGGVPGGVGGLLAQFVGSKLNFTSTEKVNRSNDPDAKSSKKKSGKDGEEEDPVLEGPLAALKLSPVMMAQLGKTDRMEISLMNGTKYKVTTNAQVVPLVTAEGNPLPANTTLNEVASSQYAGSLNTDSASMGGKLINPGSLGKVAVTSNRMAILNIPIDKERQALDGAIIPDLRYLKKLEEADKKIRELKASKGNTAVTPDEMNRIYKSMGLPVLMDSAGNLNVTDYCKFAAVNGQTKDVYLEQGGADVIAQDISDPGSVNSYLSIINSGVSNADKEEFDEDNWYDFNGHDTLYKATIFIPFSTNILNGAMTSKQNLTSKDASNIQALTEQKSVFRDTKME